MNQDHDNYNKICTPYTCTVSEPPIKIPLRKGQPRYKGHRLHISNSVLPYEAHTFSTFKRYKGQNG